MRILLLDDADYDLFDIEISSETLFFITRHMDAFKRMWQEQGKKFWLRYLLTFRSSFYERKMSKLELPEKFQCCSGDKSDANNCRHEVFFKIIIDEACAFIHKQFIEGRFNEVRNLLLEIIILAQNHSSLQYLESPSFAKDPFYAKSTREAFRHLFGNPGNKISTLKVFKLVPMYMRFVGSLHCLLRRWLETDDVTTEDDTYWTLKKKWKADPSYKPFMFECFLILHYKEELYDLLSVTAKEIDWLDKLFDSKDTIKITSSDEVFSKTGDGKLQCNTELLNMIGFNVVSKTSEIDNDEKDDKKKKKKKKKKARKDCADDEVKAENSGPTTVGANQKSDISHQSTGSQVSLEDHCNHASFDSDGDFCDYDYDDLSASDTDDLIEDGFSPLPTEPPWNFLEPNKKKITQNKKNNKQEVKKKVKQAAVVGTSKSSNDVTHQQNMEICKSKSEQNLKQYKHSRTTAGVADLILAFQSSKPKNCEESRESIVSSSSENQLSNGEVKTNNSTQERKPMEVGKSKSDDLIKYGETSSEKSDDWASPLSSEGSQVGEFGSKSNCSNSSEKNKEASSLPDQKSSEIEVVKDVEEPKSKVTQKLDEIDEHREKYEMTDPGCAFERNKIIKPFGFNLSMVAGNSVHYNIVQQGTDIEYVNKLLEAHSLLTGKEQSGKEAATGITVKKSSKLTRLRICANCLKRESAPKTYKKCQRCKTENLPEPRYYCGRQCQVEDWEENHRAEHERFLNKNCIL